MPQETNTKNNSQDLTTNCCDTVEPIAQGRIFQEMLDEKQLSIHELAAAFDINEETIQNSLKYQRAYELRNSYAAGDPIPWGIGDIDVHDVAGSINALPVPKVEAYLKLPAMMRDPWLDAEAPNFALTFLENNEHLSEIAEIGFRTADYSPIDFGTKFELALEIIEWMKEYDTVESVKEYGKVCGSSDLPPDALRCLPISLDGTNQVMLGLETWREIADLAFCDYEWAPCDAKKAALCRIVYETVLEKLLEVGLFAWDVFIEFTENNYGFLEHAPGFIRDANDLTLGQLKDLTTCYFYILRLQVPNGDHMIRSAIAELQEANERGFGRHATTIRELRKDIERMVEAAVV